MKITVLVVLVTLTFGGVGILQSQVRSQGSESFWVGDAFLPIFDFSQLNYGWAVTSGDFNCDGFADLASGLPGYDSFGGTDSGLVVVHFGSPSGLDHNDYETVSQAYSGYDPEESDDRFGVVLESGDFNGDLCDDLAVGIPWEDIEDVEDSGAVHVFYGSLDGLTVLLDQFIHQDSSGIPESNEENDRFGWSLEAGDFNGDGYDDLAVGSPHEDVSGVEVAGAVTVILGSVAKLTSEGAVVLTAATVESDFGLEGGGNFGWSLAAGRYSEEGMGWQFSHDALAIGSPGVEVSGQSRAGAVFMVQHPTDEHSATWVYTQASPGSPSQPQSFGEFGSSVAAGNFYGDGEDYLAISSKEDAPDGASYAGSVLIRPIVPDGVAQMSISREDISDSQTGENGDHFGSALLVANFNGDGEEDLVIGTPFRDVQPLIGGPRVNAGDAWVVYGKANLGLDVTDTIRLQSLSEWSMFGYSLTAGRFWGGSRVGLAVGLPQMVIGPYEWTGEVRVFDSGIFGDSFETGDVSRWSSAAL